MRRIFALALVPAIVLGLAGCSGSAEKKAEEPKKEDKAATQTLNIYSSRHYDVDKVLYDKFTKETGIKINVVEGKAPELIERLVREKDAPEADMFLTVGAESIAQLKQEDILGKFSSQTVEKNIPEKFRGEGWTGVSSRARVIAYVKGKVDPKTITSYDDLAKPEWKGQVLARPSKSSYNKALLASFIELNGKEAATKWAKGVADNFAREPKGNDRDQAKAIVAGEGKLAIMNSYYWVLLKNSADPEEQKVADAIDLIFPDKTHVNLSYAGIIKGAKNEANVVKFMEFLTAQPQQQLIAEKNGEFPLNEQTQVPQPQKGWLGFTHQDLDFEKFGAHVPDATKIFTEVGWK